ncbi:MAG: NAD(P)-binding domain-containing protein [Candidatus Promineifilaceae bacterium]
MLSQKQHPVAIIGAGPIGLAAAAHIVSRGGTPLIFEAGPQIANSIRDWGHVHFFSPWKYCVDPTVQAMLEPTGWTHPPADVLPKGDEIVDHYLQPLADLPTIAPHIRTNHKVIAITRRRIDKMKERGRAQAPFIVRAETPNGEQRFLASAVIDASGTWTTPNPIGADGLPAIGELQLAKHIRYGIPDVLNKDLGRYADKTVAVVGGGHSAINALLELGDLQADYPNTMLHWILRKKQVADAYGGLADDELPGRGALGVRIKELVDAKRLEVHTPFYIGELSEHNGKVVIGGEKEVGLHEIEVDQIIAATGSRPDLHMLRELRIDVDTSVESPTQLAPMIDPNFHSCGSVEPHGYAELAHPEKDFYIVGMKSYGRAPTFLLLTGYEQIRSVVAALDNDMASAKAVELQLPDTGVCCVPETLNVNIVEAACCAPAETPAPALISLDLSLASTDCCGPDCCVPEATSVNSITLNVKVDEACCTPVAKEAA